jgi:hypothetical protein
VLPWGHLIEYVDNTSQSDLAVANMKKAVRNTRFQMFEK